jgi:hypothetical protein
MECGMGNPQITLIAQISFSSSAASAKSADKTSHLKCAGTSILDWRLLIAEFQSETPHVVSYVMEILVLSTGFLIQGTTSVVLRT